MSSTASKQVAPSFSRADLRPHQCAAIAFAKRTNSCAWWLPMGAGKTSAALTLVADWLADLTALRVLIIAPLRVANATWPREVERWEHLAHLSLSIVTGSEAKRHAALRKSADVYVINTENVKWLGPHCPLVFDTIIIDESSKFKDPSTQRFKALRKLCKQAHRVVTLTGTPAANGFLGLWAQFCLLDGGERLGRTFGLFKDRYFTTDYRGFNHRPKEGTEQNIRAACQDITFSLTAEDVTPLPERRDTTHEVLLPEDARQQYQTLAKAFLLQFEDSTVIAINAAVLTGKLRQCSSGFLYDAHQKPHWLHQSKLDAVRGLVAAQSGKPLLIAYQFTAECDALLAAFPQAQALDSKGALIPTWNAGKIPILLAHPASAGHGLNLQFGGGDLLWFSLPWSLELYQQFNARLHRQGQSRTVNTHHLIATDTIDEVMLAALGRKATSQQELLVAVRNHATTTTT